MRDKDVKQYSTNLALGFCAQKDHPSVFLPTPGTPVEKVAFANAKRIHKIADVSFISTVSLLALTVYTLLTVLIRIPGLVGSDVRD